MPFYEQAKRAVQEMQPVTRKPMAEALADLWDQGERQDVKHTIECAMTPEAKRTWQDDVARILEGRQEGRGHEFNAYMRD